MVVVLFWDGLRPDFVTPELTPNLYRMSQKGVLFEKHHAVFPTETRVNASSTATGCYPGTHGIVGNRIVVPSANKQVALNTGNHEDLICISQKEPLLSVPTLANILQQNGHAYGIFSSGSPGSSWVQCGPGEGVMMNVRGVIHPSELLKDFAKKWGDFPEETVPATARNTLLSDMVIDAIEKDAFDVLFGWFCEPDFTQHKVGLGAEVALDAIRENDGFLGKVLDVIGNHDLMVASDHGFSSLADPFDHTRALDEAGFDLAKLVWTGNGIVVSNDYKGKIGDLVGFLADMDCIGPIFTKGKGQDALGAVAGTFSFESIQLDHARTPDIVFSRRWTQAPNAHGVAGHTYGSGGIASHGTCSPFDLHNVLVAIGPTFKNAERNVLPTGIVDIAPTIQHILFGKQVQKMDGRVVFEALEGQKPVSGATEEIVEAKRGTRTQFLKTLQVGQTKYIDSGWV